MASYALSAVLAGVAGVPLALLNVSPQMGTIIGLKAFAVAIIGGLTSAPGIVVAGLGYGLVESFTAGTFPRAREIVASARDPVLVARPWGLLGEKPSRRV
jgi:branched-chain amino acid transport system permease protein